MKKKITFREKKLILKTKIKNNIYLFSLITFYILSFINLTVKLKVGICKKET